MSATIEAIQALAKAIEAGNYDVAPSNLVQGSALQVENCSNVMELVTVQQKSIKLQKELPIEPCKSTLAQFNRQLDYGQYGGSAQLEGHVGQEETSKYVRQTLPMCFYSHTRRVTLVATLVDTQDGKKADERAAADAAMKIAIDIEFDAFRGKADFSNAGVFDGNYAAIPRLPNILGVDPQIRQSDSERMTQDLIFNEFGSDESVVLPGGSFLMQESVEDAWTRSQMNHGEAEELYVDPKVVSNYNKQMYDKQRVVLASSPQDAIGTTLKRQWVSGGTVEVISSRFLSGKTQPNPQRPNGPGIPSATGDDVSVGVVTPFLSGQVYKYTVTAGNDKGESPRSSEITVTIDTNGKAGVLTITNASDAMFYNVYRSAAGGAGAQKFIGRVAKAAGSTTTFTDLGNKQPGFVTGFLLQKDTWALMELAPYSRVKLAVTELSMPEAHFRFLTLAGKQPRKNVLIDNLR